MKESWLDKIRKRQDNDNKPPWIFEFKMGIFLTIVIIIVGHALALLGDH